MPPVASSLDVIAAQETPIPNGAMAPPVEDSRASSSTNSPAPPEAEESDFFLGNNDSASSLGVPNIQDMQVTDEEPCLVPIQTLPNEILIQVFSRLGSSSDVLSVMLTCKRFARNAVDSLWHRPACTNWERLTKICRTLSQHKPYFAYREFVKRLNLASLATDVSDGSIVAFHNCSRIERLTLTNCKKLTDLGVLPLIENNPNLLALDVSNDAEVSENLIFAIARNCRKIQGLNVTNCKNITNPSLVALAEHCKYLKRLKLNDCDQIIDSTILSFAAHCRNMLEIDLQRCSNITNEPVTALLAQGKALRELRLQSCELLDDSAFLGLPPHRIYDHLRILDLTSCGNLTDRAVEKIVDVAPRLRNLVLAKCRLITDQAVYAISKLGRNLHYVHLGHCSLITDEAVKKLVSSCNRIRYIDLGCCINLTDDSVTRLATLPKLKRIGLVKCHNITDRSVFALTNMGSRRKTVRDQHGNLIESSDTYHISSLERVHLSYCTSLSIRSIIKLLNASPRLTHLSLTGVMTFVREDLQPFCRDAPPDFNDHQRQMFCVFSGQGVSQLRHHFNSSPLYQSIREALGMVPPPQREITPTIQHGASEIMDDMDGPEDDDDEMGVDGGGVLLVGPNVPAGGPWPGVLSNPVANQHPLAAPTMAMGPMATPRPNQAANSINPATYQVPPPPPPAPQP